MLVHSINVVYFHALHYLYKTPNINAPAKTDGAKCDARYYYSIQ